MHRRIMQCEGCEATPVLWIWLQELIRIATLPDVSEVAPEGCANPARRVGSVSVNRRASIGVKD